MIEKIDLSEVQRDIEEIVRTFDTIFIQVRRQEEGWYAGERQALYKIIYQGEALIRPGSGTVDRYGAGTVENFDLVILIAGKTDVRQGDFISINDRGEPVVQELRTRLFRVMNNTLAMGAYTQVELKQHEQ